MPSRRRDGRWPTWSPQIVYGADILLKVRGPSDERDRRTSRPEPSSSACSTRTWSAPELDVLAARGVDAYAMEFVPAHHPGPGRWTLSPARPISPAIARWWRRRRLYGRAMPMMMTAAGTIAPAKVFIMGVGVAGLQAIATARPHGRRGQRHRCPRRHQGAGRVARRQVRRGRGRGVQVRRDRRRLRQADERRVSGQAGGPGLRPHQEAGHGDHHRPDPWPRRAAPGHRRAGRLDEAGLGSRSTSPSTRAAMSKAPCRTRRSRRAG